MLNKNPLTIVRIGLALVFLANGLSAFLAPQEFRELIETSFISHIIPLSTGGFLLVIGVNDILVSLLLLLNKFPKYLIFWAMLWLIGVMAVIAKPLGILEELGFFSITLALWLKEK